LLGTCFLSLQDARCEVPSDWLDGEESDLYVPAVPPGFMREVVLCYSQPLAPRSRTVYYHYFEQVLNASPGAPVVRRTALLTEDTVERFLRPYQGLKEAGLQRTNFVFDDAAEGAHAQPSTQKPAQSTARAVYEPAEAARERLETQRAAAALQVSNVRVPLAGSSLEDRT
jgi:hypothetical protein